VFKESPLTLSHVKGLSALPTYLALRNHVPVESAEAKTAADEEAGLPTTTVILEKDGKNQVLE
jgi:hypothetical protein